MKTRISIIALTALLLAGCGSSSEKSEPVTTTEAAAAVSESEQPSEDLVIPVSEITEAAKFYPVTVEGTDMEVFAVKDSKGGIRTAFNTCQSCYTSGNGRYELEGTDLVCQNCGFHFTADEIGTHANGGCSPWAILDADKTVTDTEITISYDFLVKSKQIFANWK